MVMRQFSAKLPKIKYKLMRIKWTETTQYHSKKKRQTYKEQCPVKREPTYLSALDLETQVRGKILVYVDETGFARASFREYAYAPKGICVEDRVSSN